MGNMIVQQQHDVSDIERMARAFAGSKLFGVQTAEQAIALCLIAQAEGRHPASAAQDYHIISGRPSKKADAMLRDFLANGGKVKWNTLDDATADATFTHPAGGEVRISWDMPRAVKAGIKNPMWNKYPRQMLRARTVSEGVRTVYPMATSGMYVPEEVQEFEASAANERPVIDQHQPEQAQIEAPEYTVYERHAQAIEAAESMEQLQAAWNDAKTASAAMTPDEQAWTIKRKNERKAALDTRPAQDEDPFGFNRMEQDIPFGNLPADSAEAVRNFRG